MVREEQTLATGKQYIDHVVFFFLFVTLYFLFFSGIITVTGELL